MHPLIDIPKWHLFLSLIIINGYIAYLLIKKTTTLYAVAFFYFASHAVISFASPMHETNPVQIRADAGSALAYATLLILALITLHLNLRQLSKLSFITHFIMAINAFWIAFAPSGMLNNPAMDTSFLTILLPTAIATRMWAIPAGLSISIIRFGGTSTFYFVAAAMLIAWLIQQKGKKLSYIALLLPLAVLAYLTQSTELLNSNGRLDLWKNMMIFWYESADPLLGAGTSTFPWLTLAFGGYGPDVFWPSMHNEYLQVLFEQGILGLALLLIIQITLIRHAYKKAHILFPSLIGLSVMMLTQYPFRLPLSAVMIFLMFPRKKDPYISLNKKENLT